MGDVGNFLTADQMQALAGTDILLALTGGPPTIELDELHKVIKTVKPKLVIPMHYRIPGPRFFMLPVTDFTSYYADESVTWSESSEVEINLDSLPDETQVLVLKPTLFREE
ncbi:MAG: MBL fold metallo-hydrolase, partial [Anaerolineae bacterium]|nr:MBL fold metallo-hydrolase [Anaerolineae bacterium]